MLAHLQLRRPRVRNERLGGALLRSRRPRAQSGTFLYSETQLLKKVRGRTGMLRSIRVESGTTDSMTHSRGLYAKSRRWDDSGCNKELSPIPARRRTWISPSLPLKIFWTLRHLNAKTSSERSACSLFSCAPRLETEPCGVALAGACLASLYSSPRIRSEAVMLVRSDFSALTRLHCTVLPFPVRVARSSGTKPVAITLSIAVSVPPHPPCLVCTCATGFSRILARFKRHTPSSGDSPTITR